MAKLQKLKAGQKFSFRGYDYRVVGRACDSLICRCLKTNIEVGFIGNYEVKL